MYICFIYSHITSTSGSVCVCVCVLCMYVCMYIYMYVCVYIRGGVFLTPDLASEEEKGSGDTVQHL